MIHFGSLPVSLPASPLGQMVTDVSDFPLPDEPNARWLLGGWTDRPDRTRLDLPSFRLEYAALRPEIGQNTHGWFWSYAAGSSGGFASAKHAAGNLVLHLRWRRMKHLVPTENRDIRVSWDPLTGPATPALLASVRELRPEAIRRLKKGGPIERIWVELLRKEGHDVAAFKDEVGSALGWRSTR